VSSRGAELEAFSWYELAARFVPLRKSLILC